MSMKMVAVATCYMGINDNFNYFFFDEMACF